MNMNHFSSFLTIGFAALAFGCDDGSGGDDNMGGAAGSSGGSGGSSGGSSGSSGSGGGAGTAGASGTAGGGAAEELVNPEGWIGGDPASPDDNPLGIQGAWYGYGDDGKSCADQKTRGNPCTLAEGCCISGHTIVDKPAYAAWGCGLGFSLNSTDGMPAVKSAFAGTARSFHFVIEGNTGKLPLRVNVTQAADTTGKISPNKEFQLVAGKADVTMAFADAKYPAYCATNAACMGLQGKAADPTMSYDVQVQIPGGDMDQDYNFCIKSVQALP